MEIIPVGPGFGAELRGVTLADVANDDAAYAAVRAAFEEHSVLVFRGQEVTDDLQLAFSKRFGPPEVTKVGSEKLTAGEAHWSTDPKLWFVLVKDAKKRFPGNDLWGDGWGWGLFLANNPAKNVATGYKVDCRTCHIPAKQDDWLYVRVYPGLKK